MDDDEIEVWLDELIIDLENLGVDIQVFDIKELDNFIDEEDEKE